MDYIRKGLPAKPYAWLSLTLCFTLLLSVLAGAGAGTAEAAKSNRVAVITDVGGTATVQAAGGSQAFEAYANMGLNQGDLLKTGAGSYVVLKIKDTDDELTVGENSEMSLSELGKKGSGKTTKLKMWAGSIWSSVKKLVSDEDSLEVETPTAVMGVQGTQFYVYTNPFTGRTTMVVAAGVVRASTVVATDDSSVTKALQDQKTVLVYPAQQIDLTRRDEVRDLRVKVDVVDVEQLAKQAPPKVLESIIKNKAEIDKENAEFLEKQKQALQNDGIAPKNGILNIQDQQDLDKVTKNLDNLVGNVAKEAIAEKKLEQKRAEQLADEVNKKIPDPAKWLDLQKVQPLDKNAGLDPEVLKLKAEQQKALEAERLRQEQEALKLQQELQARLDAILKQAEAEKKRLEELNQKALRELNKQAEDKFVSNLTEAERQQYIANRSNNQTGTGTRTGTGGTGSSGTGGSDDGGETGNSLPSVKLTEPSGSTLIKGQRTAVTAAASDSDGSIRLVEFFVNNNSVFQDSAAPYTFDWTPAEAGVYTLKAVATDNSGGQSSDSKTVTVSVPNLPSEVTWLTPGVAVRGSDVTLEVKAVDSDGVKSVEFYEVDGSNRKLIGTGTKSGDVYRKSWKPEVAKEYTLVAVVTDNLSDTVESLFKIHVNEPQSTPPTVTLEVPEQDTLEVQEGTGIVLKAKASDPDGIASVVFRINGQTEYTAELLPSGEYSYTWTPPAGTYQVKAVAKDRTQSAAESVRTVKVTVVPPIELKVVSETMKPTADLYVNIRNFRAQAVQLHFTTTGGQLLTAAAEPVSKIFDNSGKRTYKSGFNVYSDNGTPANYEYVFAALSVDGTVAPAAETEVFRIPVYKVASQVKVKLAFVKLILEDGTAIEITPAANHEVSVPAAGL